MECHQEAPQLATMRSETMGLESESALQNFADPNFVLVRLPLPEGGEVAARRSSRRFRIDRSEYQGVQFSARRTVTAGSDDLLPTGMALVL